MRVAWLRLGLRIDGVHSLKEKRKVVRHLVDGARSRFCVAAAEVEDLDLHNRACLGFSVVGNDAVHLAAVLDRVLEFVEADGRAEVVEMDRDMAVL